MCACDNSGGLFSPPFISFKQIIGHVVAKEEKTDQPDDRLVYTDASDSSVLDVDGSNEKTCRIGFLCIFFGR